MSRVDIAELRRLWEAAREGEWKYTVSRHGRHQISNGYSPVCMIWHDSTHPAKNTADFITAAHNSLPALLDELEAAREEVRRLESDNAKLAWAWNEVQSDTAQEALDKARLIQAAHVCLDSLVWLKIRDRSMKLIGAAEWLEREARDGGYYERSCEGMLEEAAQLRREAEE